MIALGDVLRNRYRIERSIGRGGMGEVFAAVVQAPAPGRGFDNDATLVVPSVASPRVAIKVVRGGAFTEALMTRLQREATAASRIESAFVPRLLDIATTDDGELFIVMELLHGETLAARLKGRGCLTWDEVFQMGDDVLSGLIDAHAAGVVHRDLKPSNIFLCEPSPAAADDRERSKVLDFGVCKLDTPVDDEKLTTTGESVGTASYMAPEQIRGASGVNERADLYSFGTVVFEALSGQLPHSAVGQMAMLASKLERTAIRLSELAQVPVPVGLEALLAELLARDAKRRPVSAMDVRNAWRALGEPSVQPNPSAVAPVTSSAQALTDSSLSTGTVEVTAPTSRVGIALAAFSLTASAVVLVAMLVARRGDARRDAPVVDDFSAPVAVAAPPPRDPPPDPPLAEPVASAAAVSPPPASGEDWYTPGTAPPSVGVSDAGAVDASPAATPPGSKLHPQHRWQGTRPPPPKQPHIADKPRY